MTTVHRGRFTPVLAFLIALAVALLGGVFLRQADEASAAVVCTITGTPGPDNLTGTSGDDVLSLIHI